MIPKPPPQHSTPTKRQATVNQQGDLKTGKTRDPGKTQTGKTRYPGKPVSPTQGRAVSQSQRLTPASGEGEASPGLTAN